MKKVSPKKSPANKVTLLKKSEVLSDVPVKKRTFMSDEEYVIKSAVPAVSSDADHDDLGEDDIRKNILKNTLSVRQSDTGGFVDKNPKIQLVLTQEQQEEQKRLKALLAQLEAPTKESQQSADERMVGAIDKVQSDKTAHEQKLILTSRNHIDVDDEVKKFKNVAHPYDRAIVFSTFYYGIDAVLAGVRIVTKMDGICWDMMQDVKAAVCLAVAKYTFDQAGTSDCVLGLTEIEAVFGTWVARVVEEFPVVHEIQGQADIRTLQAAIVYETDKIIVSRLTGSLSLDIVSNSESKVSKIMKTSEHLSECSTKDHAGFYASAKDFTGTANFLNRILKEQERLAALRLAALQVN